ncbi:SsrA-binding protein SmpB [candidate division WWE3 bacterium]|nr:SsrA-binding protein SmpB [candidate division WWE3 bacterium]
MLLAKNRKALYNHEIIEKYLAGVVLKGYEVKAIREGKISFEGSYIKVQNGEAFAINIHIGKYSKQSQELSQRQEKHPLKLLLNQREIEEIARETHQKGKTAVPIAFVLRNNMIKLELAVVKGRKEYEKKQLAKKRQVEKDLQRQRKNLKFGDDRI